MDELLNRCGTDEKCAAALVKFHRPTAFRRPDCRDRRHTRLIREGRTYWRCHRSSSRATVTSGTISQARKPPLSRRFLATHQQAKNKVPALELKRHLGDYYKTAPLVNQKQLEVVKYRFNRRFDLSSIHVQLVRAAALTAPSPMQAIRLADVSVQ